MGKKIGLVFAGGGGKGAYQIGVWKAFKEYGVADNIQAVAGSSVGALNGALFVQGDLTAAKQLWLSISSDKILSCDNSLVRKIAVELGSNSRILKWIDKMKNHGIFSRSGLKKIIKQDLDLDYLSSSDISLYAAACRLPSLQVEYFNLNGCAKERFISILLASSALPIIFGREKIGGKSYLDGGIKDNTPVKPLYNEGCDLVFVVYLSQKLSNRDFIDKSNYPNCQIVEIVPQEELGSLVNGTLDFTGSGAFRRIEQGYRDTKNILEPIFKMVEQGAKIDSVLDKLRNDEREFQKQQRNILKQQEQARDRALRLDNKKK